jgi:hypothetical protein
MEYQEDRFRMKCALKHLVRVGLVTAAVLMGMVAFQGAHTQAAHAAPLKCSANGGNGYASCNNLDPTSTQGPDGLYCNKWAYPQGNATTYSWGWIQNWWSEACNANWTQLHVNSGYIAVAGVWACNGTGSFDQYGDPTCNGSLTNGITSVCDATSSYNTYCNYLAYDMPAGTTSWYTNMVRGDEPTISVAYARENGTYQRMETGWH